MIKRFVSTNARCIARRKGIWQARRKEAGISALHDTIGQLKLDNHILKQGLIAVTEIDKPRVVMNPHAEPDDPAHIKGGYNYALIAHNVLRKVG